MHASIIAFAASIIEVFPVQTLLAFGADDGKMTA
jgi:hypothetical protein